MPLLNSNYLLLQLYKKVIWVLEWFKEFNIFAAPVWFVPFTQLWQLETLLLQRDTYMNYSRPLSTASVGWSQNLGSFRPKNVMRRVIGTLRSHILENWQRGWILMLWFFVMAGLFAWKFYQYRNRAAFQVMGYCVATAKGAAETLKLNMALILLPVCRNTLTWLRSTRARSFIPFDDNINFHKVKLTKQSLLTQ